MPFSAEFSLSPGPGEALTAKPADTEETDWKKELANATRSVRDLLIRLKLTDSIRATDINPDFKCLVTDNFIGKMQPGDFNDPLLRQVLPLSQESDVKTQNEGSTDPVGDVKAMVSPGLLHKYHGRALVISTAACAVHCRYCFRRTYPYRQSTCHNTAVTAAVEYLNRHEEIEELILSGGDPLTLDNEKLASLSSALEAVPHIHTLRIHTRMPLVLPDRINRGLLKLLQRSRFQIVMVIHANHANELQATEAEKLHLLHKAGVSLLNQSVLLKGINDNADQLIALSKRLFQCNTLPYYLHSLDPVKGAMHFRVNKQRAVLLLQQMEQQLPGYLVPRLVEEIAGNKAKTAILHI